VADVFLSYARGEEPLARTIAQHLTDAGFSVWWDSDLLPHDSFAQVIERELRAAPAVLVIWSDRAVASQWVRAEADLARDQGKLIQVSIDSCSIPLPFNQYQIASLRGWKGDPANPQWHKVVASVAELTAKTATEPPPRPAGLFRSGPRPDLSGQGRSRRTALTVLLVVLAIGGFLAARMTWHSSPRGTRIAIHSFQPIGDAPALRDFAASISASLQNALTQDQLQTVSSPEAASLNGPDASDRAKALGVGLVFSGTVRSDRPVMTANMQLEDPLQHATLWTAEVSGPAASSEQLQARVGALTVAVLNCSAQALKPTGGITDPNMLQTFLHACDLAETTDHGIADEKGAYAMLDAMRQVARGAPDFAVGHSVLAKHLAFLVPMLAPDQTAALKKEAEEEAHRALAIDPRDPDGFVALGLLAHGFAQREYFFRQALASDPSWPHANGFLGNVMTDIGQIEEAATLYARAAAVNPLSHDWAHIAARGLIWNGHVQEADAALARLAALWPGDTLVWRFQFQSMVAQGRWDDALAVLDRGKDLPGAASADWLAGWRALLLALKTNDPIARSALRKEYLSGRVRPQDAMTRLGMLGFVDDAFAVAQKYVPGDDEDGDFLFSPLAAPLRHDPRFIALAAKFGLVDYWRKTGRWPDFCSETGLPYNCKTVAAQRTTR
jgi:tetratricopeptide (TPR) repeat protein